MFHSYLLTKNRVSQCYECDAEDDAGSHVAGKCRDVSSLQHEHALVGEGREGGEATAQSCREQQCPRAMMQAHPV